MSVGMLFVGQVGQLPLLAVLVVGFVVLGSRGKRLGARSVLLARLGLGTLTLGMILGIAWTMLIPTLYSRLDYSVARYGLLFSGLGLITSLLSAGGIGLLIAAVVSRESGPPSQDGPFAGGAPADAAPAGGGVLLGAASSGRSVRAGPALRRRRSAHRAVSRLAAPPAGSSKARAGVRPFPGGGQR